MGEKIVVGPLNKGLRNDVTPFVIDNESFPMLINSYQWRGRVKRKRGTSLLGRLKRTITAPDTDPILNLGFGWTNLLAYAGLSPASIFITNITQAAQAVVTYTFVGGLDYAIGEKVFITAVIGMSQINDKVYTITNKVGNQLTLNVDSTLFTPYGGGGIVVLQGLPSIVPGSINFSDGVNTYTDPSPQNGMLSINGVPNVNTYINYNNGLVNLNFIAPPASVTGTFSYYPNLPVMGLEELALISTQFPGTLAFDTTYSYNINTTFPYDIYDVSFYKNIDDASPPGSTYPGYIEKTFWTPTTWNGQDYQQFWTVNYEGALWATNGINVPFSITNIGMQYKPIVTVTGIVAGPPAFANLQITGHGLVVGDFVFINEVLTTTGINYQTGYVTVVIDANNVTVEFPNATIATNGTGGIAQYLTNRSSTTIDSLRWYDGDPTNGISPLPSTSKGWVNFSPPLNNIILFPNFSIADLPPDQYYLVGARMIVPFKDRLLFLGPVIQTSAAGSQVYLQDTIVYSQNGTPYYTASFTGDPSLATTVFHPILVPDNKTASPVAYWEDLTGFGGFISAGVAQPIITSSSNEDVLIVGFSNMQTRVVYSGNDLIPFNFFLINSELGSGSTFSAINMDKGVLTRGQRGYINTSQTGTQRIDLDIPDEVFQISLNQNGNERFTAQRDFINEWVYFTFPENANQDKYKFPNQTLQFNYRDNTWAIFKECYTTYGPFLRSSGFTWGNIGTFYPTWGSWNVPWNAGSSTIEQPEVIGGNQQGFVIFRDEGTDEANSLYIQSFTGSLVTSPDHTLNQGDYIIISGVLGTVGTEVNGKIFSVSNPTANTFILNPTIGSGTYLGGGLIKRMYVPFIQTRQFPVSWSMARKTRIGVQQYLFTTTPNSQIQLLIFLSQNDEFSYSDGPIVPSINVENDSLIYSSVLFTCPESTNLGLLPSNINLNMVTAKSQLQTWHRMNTSLLGDTVQIGFTMSDAQMRSLTVNGIPIAITGVSKSNPCVLTTTANYAVGTLIQVDNVVGMTQLNQNRYIVLSSTATKTSIDVDSTSFTTYISGGTTTPIAPKNQFAEIELHGFILDVSPSMLLA